MGYKRTHGIVSFTLVYPSGAYWRIAYASYPRIAPVLAVSVVIWFFNHLIVLTAIAWCYKRDYGIIGFTLVCP